METIIENPGTATADRIEKAYREHILEHGQQPASVYRFSADLGIQESEFYRHFGSFEGVERAIWEKFITRTIDKISNDEGYQGFTTRDKLLTFYYALFENLKHDRSFILVQLKKQKTPEFTPAFLKDFKERYINFVRDLIEGGKGRGEIARRPFFDKRYAPLFWYQMAFLLLFWRDDNSAGFEKTDAAVEKSVNLAFEFIGKGPVDSVIDFAKFLYQTKFK